MMYVNDRSADSICETALEFLAMKSEYMPSHFGGIESTSLVRWVACLYIAGTPVNGEYGWTYRGGVVVMWCCGGWSSQSGEVTLTLAWSAEVQSNTPDKVTSASDIYTA